MRDELYPANPRKFTLVDADKKTVTDVYDYRGTQKIPQRPSLLPCDFCLTNTDWLCGFPKRPHCVFYGKARFVDEATVWWACLECAPLVRDGDLATLVGRVMVLNPAMPVMVLKVMYRALFDVMESHVAPVLWKSGEPWPK